MKFKCSEKRFCEREIFFSFFASFLRLVFFLLFDTAKKVSKAGKQLIWVYERTLNFSRLFLSGLGKRRERKLARSEAHGWVDGGCGYLLHAAELLIGGMRGISRIISGRESLLPLLIWSTWKRLWLMLTRNSD